MLDLIPVWPEPQRSPPAGPHTWAQLAPNTPYAGIFPDGRVPLQSILPITPREAGAPLCYLVDVTQLTESQIWALAEALWRQWRPECTSAGEAVRYMRAEGLPMRAAWFDSITTTRLALLVL